MSDLLHSSTAAWSLSKSASVWHRLPNGQNMSNCLQTCQNCLHTSLIFLLTSSILRCFVLLCAALKSQKDAAKDLDNADCNSSAAARRSCNTFCRFNTVQLHLLKAKKSKMKKTKYCANSLQNLQDVQIIPSTRDQTSTLLTIFVLGKQSSPNRTNVFHSNETTKDAQRSIMQCL